MTLPSSTQDEPESPEPTARSTDESIQRVAAGLRTALRLTGVSHRFCERELGLSTGYLTRILAGQVELRVRVVLDLCRILGLPPAALFAALFPVPQISQTTTRILRGLGAVHPSPSTDPFSEALSEIRDTLDKIVNYLHEGEPPLKR